ncbi:MAG: hypothetical protein MUP66_00845 [Candidatus Nanohaloarchaeota archaeon QJJ-5]|nr:hypothetical protein [Candidatus Nanohaloarchaeota archaeon QJJ-5]
MSEIDNIPLKQVIEDQNTYIKARDRQIRQHITRHVLTQKTADTPTRLLVFSAATGDYWGCDIEGLIEPLCDSRQIDNLKINRIDRTGNPIATSWDEIIAADETVVGYQFTSLSAAYSTPEYSALDEAAKNLIDHRNQLIMIDTRPPHRTLTETLDAIAAITRDNMTIDTTWLSSPPRQPEKAAETGQRQLDTFLEPAAP